MSPIKTQLLTLIDYLPETEQALLVEIVKRFVPDDVATPDDIEAIEKGLEEYRNGETIGLDEYKWK